MSREVNLVREVPVSEPAEPTPDVPFPNALMVSQENTDNVLRRRLHELGGTVEMDCALLDFTEDDCKVAASVNRSGQGETVSARYLVGCDGGGSTVRKCAGISFTGETWEDAASYLIGNLSVKGPDRRHWHVWTDTEWGYLTLQPIIHGETWLFVATIQGQELAEGTFPTAESMQRVFERRIPYQGIVIRDLKWHSVYRRNLRTVERYRVGRVFLAGDSAHVGVEHGMNIGIQEACNLSWKLAQVVRGAPDALLDTYQEERYPIARQILDTTLNRDRSNSGGAAAAQSIRGAISSKEFANDPTQLSVNYAGSRLSRDFDRATTIRAGNRAPDAPGLKTDTGRFIHLFESLGARKFTLLHFTGGAMPEFPGQVDALGMYRIMRPGVGSGGNSKTLVDTQGHAYRAYGVDAEALVLVRPDGYVAATGTPDRASEMLQHLRLATP